MFLVFGGRDETNIFSDLYIYNIDTNSWSKATTSDDSQPKSRFGHTSVVNKKSMFVFGGWDGNETLNDIKVFNIETSSWQTLANVKGSVKGRYRHTAACNDHAMYIFGGIDQQQERFNDIYEFVFETLTWSRLITIGNAPSKRTFH